MGGAQQFFRIGAGAAFKARLETIGGLAENAALGRKRADAVLEAALPSGGAVSAHVTSLL